ncbi:hypothetical protein GCM10023144_01910 [Pigmentiphaga soli]|uniref:Uncharacterized protein n=1 Tax=Pigmentiphaga soli TaxID=1007095 RepID=A0ABP8GDT4_9BURK
MRIRHVIACALLLGGGAVAAVASESAGAPRAGPSCFDVEVNGQRAQSYECLTQKMMPAPQPQGDAQATMRSEQIAQRPANQLGLANRAATAVRMGNTFGKSVYPQRPPNAVQHAPIIPGRQP